MNQQNIRNFVIMVKLPLAAEITKSNHVIMVKLPLAAEITKGAK